jgi:tetratricopeptide (TPR) repeat protein
LCLSLIALGVAAPARAQGTPPAPTLTLLAPPPTIDPMDILEAAKSAQESASNAVDLLNFMLAFIQVAAIISGGLIALVGVALSATGFRTIRDYRQQLTSSREELDKIRQQLEEQTTRAGQVLEGFEARINVGLEEVKSQGDKAIRALSLLQLGEQQMEQRNMKAALQTMLEAYQLDPSNRATNYFLGELYIQQRDMAKGIEHLQKTRNERGDYYPAGEAALAYALRVQGDKEQDPNQKNRLYAQAENHFITALSKDANMRDINGESFHGALGGLYRRQGRLADAVRCYLQAEKVTPHSAYPVNNLAMLYHMQGNMTEATRYFEQSHQMAEQGLAANPGDYWLRFNIITALTAINNTQAALGALEQVIDILPGPGPLDSLLDGIRALQGSPTPPPGVEIVIGRIQQAIQGMKAKG